MRNEIVDTLIDSNTKWWDVHKIIALIFNASIATDILKIIISPKGGEDKRIWKNEKDGIFSVKSAYKLLTKREI